MIEEKIKELKSYINEISNLDRALEIIYWDTQTKMPKKSVEQRGEIIEYLSGEIFKMTTSDKMQEVLNYLDENNEDLNDIDKAIIKNAKKNFEETKKIPESRYKEFVVASTLSQVAWEEAKEKNDFEIFKPHLKTMIDFQREFVNYWGYENNKYDTLLNRYEEGMSVEKLDKIFSELKVGIIEILDEIKKSKKIINREFFIGDFPKEKQEKFSKFVLNKMGYDFNSGRLDESVHPFTISFGNKDVRITTNYNNDFTSSLYSCIHEGGHGIFDQNIEDKYQKTGLEKALSMSIHESQSRFYENLIGRSKEFWEYFIQYAKYEFEEFRDIDFEDFYDAINYVKPSLIRTEADELTYSLHIIIRYEIEKALINGEIDIDDVKEVWNSKYKEYLGITPKNDAEGILQDVHWSDGSFGYFPSYALGNIYGAQILKVMEKEYKELYEDIKKGNLLLIKDWLNKNIYSFAPVKTPEEIIKNLSGEELNPKYFLEYLKNKFLKIYK